jgi:hypothetical protein
VPDEVNPLSQLARVDNEPQDTAMQWVVEVTPATDSHGWMYGSNFDTLDTRRGGGRACRRPAGAHSNPTSKEYSTSRLGPFLDIDFSLSMPLHMCVIASQAYLPFLLAHASNLSSRQSECNTQGFRAVQQRPSELLCVGFCPFNRSEH